MSEEMKNAESAEPAAGFVYLRKTDAELETLAQDIVAGRVYHSVYHGRQMDEAGVDLSTVFMPLLFSDQEHLDAMKAGNIVAIYEYLDKAGPRAVNGQPGFMSMQLIDKDDSARLHERVTAIAEFNASRLKTANGG